jgi:hypothetical protein
VLGAGGIAVAALLAVDSIGPRASFSGGDSRASKHDALRTFDTYGDAARPYRGIHGL